MRRRQSYQLKEKTATGASNSARERPSAARVSEVYLVGGSHRTGSPGASPQMRSDLQWGRAAAWNGLSPASDIGHGEYDKNDNGKDE
jgi:hypothetical protein